MPSALSHYLDDQHVCGGILPQTSLRTQVPLPLLEVFFFCLSVWRGGLLCIPFPSPKMKLTTIFDILYLVDLGGVAAEEWGGSGLARRLH